MSYHLVLGSMPASPWAALVVTFTMTLLVHAAAWASVAALGARSTQLGAATRHTLWKLALLGPLATALLASARPAQRDLPLVAATQAALAVSSQSHAAARLPTVEPLGEDASALPSGLAHALVAAAALGLLRFTLLALSLARRLRTRSEVADARLLARLERLRRRAGLASVTLTECSALTSPLVLGRREICLPRGSLSALADAEVDAVLAHELAHLARGDGVWFPLVGLLESVLWMQPLQRWVAARFRESAELAADARAVALTGDPLALARALTDLAHEALGRAALVPHMARSGSALRRRVTRLVTGAGVEAARPRRRVGALALSAATGVLVASLRVEAVEARAMPTAAERARTAHHAAARASTELRDERARIVALTGERDALLASSSAQGAEAREARLLELEQALRHAQATALWLEDRLARGAQTTGLRE